jgi:hypothetical protein
MVSAVCGALAQQDVPTAMRRHSFTEGRSSMTATPRFLPVFVLRGSTVHTPTTTTFDVARALRGTGGAA